MSPDELNNIVDLALTTPEQFARLRELAREAAVRNHPGHLSGNFNTCPHPDCVLVRASAPSVAPCPDPFNETHEHEWVTETRCYRCGVVTAIKDGDHISFSTTGKPNPPKWPESAPSVVEPAKERTMNSELGWVIERYVLNTLLYWNGHGFDKNSWTPKHQDAVRFARADDANVVLARPLQGEGRVVQHSWDVPAPSAVEAKEP